jgi:hypothetical protein
MEREYVKIGELVTNLRSYETNLDKWDILEAIRLKLNVSNDSPITILWRVDEVQQMDRNLSDPSSGMEKRHSDLLHKYIHKWMSFVMDAAGTPTFIIPVCSCTSDRLLVKIISNVHF